MTTHEIMIQIAKSITDSIAWAVPEDVDLDELVWTATKNLKAARLVPSSALSDTEETG